MMVAQNGPVGGPADNRGEALSSESTTPEPTAPEPTTPGAPTGTPPAQPGPWEPAPTDGTATPYEPGVQPDTGGHIRRGRTSAPRSRVGGVWVSSVLFAAVLLLLLIFILENSQSAEISFFGQHGHIPQGVALLLAAVFGILLVAIPGTARIIQLRLRDRHARSKAANR